MIENRLLDTAIDQFGRFGFEGASTREIARASGTAMSSITYHFGGKQGLYLAAADYIAERVRERQASSIAAMTKAVANVGSLGRTEATEQLLGMLDSFAHMMLSPESGSWARFIVREQQSPTEAFERIYEKVMRPMTEAFVALMRIARPDLEEREARGMAIMLHGQVLILRVGRASVCKILGASSLEDEEMSLLRQSLRNSASCILNGGPH